jgi:hypothetical protein
VDSDHLLPIPEATIREELSRVLSGHEFRSSKRSQEFLRYVVENTLTGHSEILKERTIGIEVFGRPVSYDPSEDATVRVKAGEVRKRLGMYYAAEGVGNPLRIELPAGTYVPEFRRNGVHTAAEHPRTSEVLQTPLPVREHAVEQAGAGRKWLIGAVIAVVVVAPAVLWIWSRSKPPVTALDLFWAPVLQGSAPVSVCAAFVPLIGRDPKLPPQLDALMADQFVGGGDLIAVSRLSALLTRRLRPYHVRIGDEISLHDLEVAPAIMVGYSHTHWKEISRELRFFIDGSRNPVGITDHGAPTKWALPNLSTDRHTSEDYAIVSRVFHPDTNAMLVEIAGITQYGTDAASDLVTNPDLMAEALRGAPADWPKKNLQLVLHVKVISEAPSSPRVVATYFW